MQYLEKFITKENARIGILGGTFDPVHNAHISLCHAAKEQFSLDYILLLIVGDPPHKSNIASAESRLEMARLCVKDEPFIKVCTLEMERSGKTYTVDTLKQLKSIFPSSSLYYIIGTDTLLTLTSWKDIDEVFSMTEFICFSRPNVDDSEARYQLSMQFGANAGRVHFALERGLNISSTEIRARAAQNLQLAGFLPRNVELYIIENKLYKDSAPSFAESSKMLAASLSPKRYMHSLAVAECAAELAQRFNVDVWQARWAGLLHDCAKHISYKEALRISAEFGIDLQNLSAKPLIHAPLGAFIARKNFKMFDEEILRAIKYHTTGTIGMTKLDKIIYLADSIEPGRTFEGAYKIRGAAKTNLDKATFMAMNSAIQFVLNKEEVLNPLTVSARNELLKQLKDSQEV